MVPRMRSGCLPRPVDHSVGFRVITVIPRNFSCQLSAVHREGTIRPSGESIPAEAVRAMDLRRTLKESEVNK